MKHAVVIGAGVAGLATAALLGRTGMEVTVVERGEETGGRAGSFSADGFHWDTGPSWYLMPEAFDHFFELCGTTTAEAFELCDLQPAYRIFNERGERLDVQTGRADVAALFEQLEPGAGAKVGEYLETATQLYELAIDRFLYTTFSHPSAFLNTAVLRNAGLLLRLLSSSLERYVGAVVETPRLRQVLEYPAVFLSTEPKAAPALYSLMSHTDLVEGVRYPQGGFNAVVKAIEAQARKAGASILLSQEVEEIVVAQGKVQGVRTAEGLIEADVVVSAADLQHTETQLLAPKWRTYSEKYFEGRDPGVGAVLVLLGVEGALPELAHHTLLFSSDWSADFTAVFHSENPADAPKAAAEMASASIYISKTSATDPDVAPSGMENLFVLIPTKATETLGGGSAYGQESEAVAKIADRAIAQIAKWAGIADLPQRIVSKHTIGPADFAGRYNAFSAGAIGPAHTLRQSAFLRGRNASRKVESLLYAGATTVPGVGVPMCLISAENVVKRLAGDRSHGPLAELPDLT